MYRNNKRKRNMVNYISSITLATVDVLQCTAVFKAITRSHEETMISVEFNMTPNSDIATEDQAAFAYKGCFWSSDVCLLTPVAGLSAHSLMQMSKILHDVYISAYQFDPNSNYDE